MFIATMRILFIRSGGLGDFILSLPVLGALRQTWPEAHIEILGKPGIASLGLGPSYAEAVTSIDEARFARLFSDARLEKADPLIAYLSGFDLAVSFLGAADSAFGQKLASFAGRVLFIAAPSSGQGHACQQFLSQLESLGIVASDGRPRVSVEPVARTRGKHLLREALGDHARGPILMHPGSGSPRKNWPPDSFAALARSFRHTGFSVALIEGEADRAAVEALQAVLEPETEPVLQNLSVLDLAGAICEARLFVGNDSGVTHLAGSVDTPVVCMFGPTDASIWAPRAASARVLRLDASPERVCHAALELIGPR